MKTRSGGLGRRLASRRFLRFAAVGGSGVLVNMGTLALLTEVLGIPYAVSSLVAIELSILSNFTLNDRWTWREVAKKPYGVRLLQYHVSVGLTALLGNWLLLLALTGFFHVHYLVANLVGIGVGTLINFLVNDVWTFGKPSKQATENDGATPVP